MKRVVRVAALALLGTALVTVLLESTIGAIAPLHIGRLADFRRIAAASESVSDGAAAWRLRQGTDLTLGGGSYRLEADPAGRRLVSPATLPETGARRRLVAFGDGAVFGIGVAADATLLRVVEDELRRATGDAWEVVDLSHPFETLDRLPERLKAAANLAPELVLVFDRASAGGLSGELRAIRDGELPRAGWGHWLPSIHDVVWRLAHPPTPGDGPIVRVEELAEAVLAARQNGVPAVVVDLGARSERLTGACERLGIPCLSAATAPGATGTRGIFDPLEGYPDELGQRRIGERLAAGLGTLLAR